jgi:hypothetical protein
LTVLALYFKYLSRDWFPLFLTVTVLGLIALLFMLVVVPDNTKWLLIEGRREEAISAFNKIAKINGSNFRIESDAIFVEFEDTPN